MASGHSPLLGLQAERTLPPEGRLLAVALLATCAPRPAYAGDGALLWGLLGVGAVEALLVFAALGIAALGIAATIPLLAGLVHGLVLGRRTRQLGGDLDQARDHLAEIDTRVTASLRRVDELAGDTTALTEASVRYDTRREQDVERIARLETALRGIEVGTPSRSELEAVRTERHQGDHAISQRVDTLERHQGRTDAEIADLKDAVTRLESSVVELARSIGTIRASVGTIEDTTGQIFSLLQTGTRR